MKISAFVGTKLCLIVILAGCCAVQAVIQKNCTNPTPDDSTTKKYFVFNAQTATYWGAVRICRATGMRLATINSAEENKLIQAATDGSSNSRGPWWVAGTDEGSEGSWFWLPTNEYVGHGNGYTNWSPGQPDNAYGNENCMNVGYYNALQWNDANCTLTSRFICESINSSEKR